MAASTSRLVIEISSEQAKRNAEQLNRELQSIERNGTFATRSMDAMSVATRSLAAQMTALVSAGVLISKMDTYTGLQNRLKLVTASQNELKQAMKDTFIIAQATGQAWDSTAQVYQRFADNAKRLGITLEQTASLTDTVAKSISISGGSAASAEAALVQFGQALASGVLRGEEFNSISEQAPALLKAIATGLNTNIGQLRSMAAQGQLTADVVIKSLEKAKVSVDTLFGKTDFTIGQSFQMLNNEVTKFIGEAGKSSGAAKLTADSIQLLSQNLEGLVVGLQIAGAYYVGTFIPAIYASVAAGIAKAKQMADQTVVQYGLIQAEKAAAAQELANASAKLASTEGTLAALQAERALEIQRLKAQISAQGLAASQSRLAGISQVEAQVKRELIALTAAQTAAQERLNVVQGASLGVGRGLMGLLGGPAGLAGIAVAVGTSMLLMRDNTNSATDAFDLQKQSVADLADTYSKLTSAKLVSEMDETAKKLEKAKDLIDDARSKLLGMVQGSQDYIDDRTIQQQKIMLDVLEQIKTGSIDAAKALQTLQASRAFDKNEIQQARNYFANLEEGEAVVAALTAKQQLANSALNKASGLYENLEGKARGLSEEQAQLSKELETSKTNFDFISKALLQTAQNSGVSKDGMNELKVAINQYSEDSLKATELLKLFQRFIPISNSDIETYSRLAIRVEAQKEAYARNKKELEGVNKQQSEFIKNSPNAIKGINDITEARNKETEATRAAQKALDSYRSSALNDIKEMSARLTLMKLGLSDNQIEQLMKVLKALNYDPKLTGTDEAKQMFAIAQKMSEMQTAEDKLTDSRKQRYQYTKQELEMLQRVQKLMITSGLDKYAESKGIPSSVISGLMAQESGGVKEAKSPTGAIGYWQTTKDYRSDNRLTVSDSYDLVKTGKVVIDNIAKVYAKTGDLAQAVLSHNAGVAGAAKFTETGKVSGKEARQKEVANYVPSIAKWESYFAGGSGILGGNQKELLKFNEEFIKSQVKANEEISKMRDVLASEDIQRLNAHNKNIADITKNFTGQERDKYIMQENQRYDATESLAKLQFESQVQGWRWVGEERIKNQATVDKAVIDATRSMTDQQKALAKASIDDQVDYEITQYRLAKEQRMLQSKEFFLSEMQLVQARYELEKKLLAQSKEDPSEKEFKLKMLELQNQMGMDKRLKDASMGWDSVQAQMNGSSGRYQVGQERFSRMSVSQNLFDTQLADVEMQEKEPGADLQKLAEVREQIWAAHNQRMIDIENQYQTDSLNLQLTQAQQLTGSFANMFKGILGESSGAYKTMFAMQQGFALTQAGMNLWSSVSDAYAKEPGTVWQKMAAGAKAALDQGTFLAMIQAITPQGFSTGGHVRGSGTETSDSIPAMLSDNEYVIKAKSVRSLGVDTLDYINRMGALPVKRASGGSVGATSSYIVDRYKSDSGFKVTINNYGNDEVQTSQDADGNLMVAIGKILDQKIDSGVDRGIQRNLRQGYPLSNAIKGK